jgi:hypothetical protein|tara:strand:- start:6849 stop:7085 length:237 start_codon:yes stop_codon:yes gene_type:complete
MLTTFHQCIEEAEKFLAKNNIVCSEFSDKLFTGGISYGQTMSFNFKIDRLNGRFTKQFFHFIVNRDESGHYEAINYAL